MSIGAKLSAVYRRDRHISRLILMMVVWAAFMAITRFDKFYTLINFQTMASQFPEFGLMSLGIMVCMITGGIDLSTVGVANLVSICAAMLMKGMANEEGEIAAYVIPLCFVIAIALGAAAGAFNGLLISRIRIPPILATLGTSELFTGIAIVLTDGKAVSKLPRVYSSTINSKIFGLIPTQLVYFAVMALILWF